MMRQKKGAPLLSAKGEVVANTGAKASWITPKDAGNRGVGGLLPRVTCLGSRLYPPPRLHRHQGWRQRERNAKREKWFTGWKWKWRKNTLVSERLWGEVEGERAAEKWWLKIECMRHPGPNYTPFFFLLLSICLSLIVYWRGESFYFDLRFIYFQIHQVSLW